MRATLVPLLAGLLAAFVAFASSFSVILQGFAGVGATPAEAASSLMALSVAMGVCCLLVSLRTRMPVAIAWSTPGAALLAGAGVPTGGYPVAVGAFLTAGALLLLAGTLRPLADLLNRIPASLANAMLAGILLPVCLAPVRAVAEWPAAGLLVAAVWFAVGLRRRLLAVPAAALATIGVILATRWTPGALGDAPILPPPLWVWPEFTLAGTVGIALPLFLVSLASQAIPGLAILRVNGFDAPAGSIFRWSGAFSVLAAPFGAHAVSLAAMTAAITAGPEGGPDPARRWWGGVSSGVAYVLFGLGAGLLTAFAALAPVLIQAMAGFALLGALTASLRAMADAERERGAATLCFLVTASGTAFAGIGAPFWGLAVGALALAAERWRR